jgi:hypothetical protein
VVPLLAFFERPAGISSGGRASKISVMTSNLAMLFILTVSALLPLMVGVREYRRTGKAGHAIGAGAYFGPFAWR